VVLRAVRFFDVETCSRFSSRFMDRLNSQKLAGAAPCLAITTTSHPSSTFADAAAAFRRRLILFLVTALPSRLLTENPKRVVDSPRLAITTNLPSDLLLPSRQTAANSRDFLRRRSGCMQTVSVNSQ
jgi:hypothetical protein